jgi:hypothetical protein
MDRVISKNNIGEGSRFSEAKMRETLESSVNGNCRFKPPLPPCLHSWTSKMQYTQVSAATSLLNLPKTTRFTSGTNSTQFSVTKRTGMGLKHKRASDRNCKVQGGKKISDANAQIFVQWENSKSSRNKNIKGYGVIGNFISLAACRLGSLTLGLHL